MKILRWILKHLSAPHNDSWSNIPHWDKPMMVDGMSAYKLGLNIKQPKRKSRLVGPQI